MSDIEVLSAGYSTAMLLGSSRQGSGTTRVAAAAQSEHACFANASVFFGFRACISSACSVFCSLPCAWEVLMQLRHCASACSTGSFLLFLLLQTASICLYCAVMS